MAEETIFTNFDFTGGSFEEGSVLSLGTRFHVTEPGDAVRARFYCPPSGPGGSGAVNMRLYRVADAALLATASFPSPTVGAWNEAPWIVSGSPASVPLVINTVYSTSYVTPNRYVASTAYAWPKVSSGLRIESEVPGGYFSSGDALPAGTFGGNNYYADIVIEFGGEAPSEGSAALGLDLAVAATGGRISVATADLGIGLAVTATGSSPHGGSAALTLDLGLTATGARDSAGSAALGLGLAPAATGGRDSVGAAALGLGLAPSGTGARASLGAAALTLNLAVSGAGSNGDIGCPVPLFPFAPRSVTVALTPRAVRSFPGGECT